ncbi:MAG: ABC transporter permease [Actinomycetota bacterium]|nr:ABC transporter permease [Actinomycetota bacterium]
MAVRDKDGTEIISDLDPDTAEPTEALPESLWRVRLSLGWKAFKKNGKLFLENKIGLLGLGLISIFVFMALAYPILTTWGPWQDTRVYDPVIGFDAPPEDFDIVPTEADIVDPTTQMDVMTAQLWCFGVVSGGVCTIPKKPASPSSAHWLGTDPLGRDIAAQLAFSTRSAFMLGLIAAVVTVGVATFVGSVAAFFGGWLDSFLMRLADLVLLLPLIPILIVMSGLFEVTLPLLGVMIGILSGFGGTAIVLKSQALSIKVKPFLDAARVSGGSQTHLIFRHIIPNVLPLSFLYMMFTVTEAISLEATLSFFGLINVPMSWGLMIFTTQTQGYLRTGLDFWWLLIPAGLAVTLLAAGFFFVGRAMDEVINPRLRAR